MGVFFAFSDTQFEEQKKEGVKYASVGAGCICPVDNVKPFIKAFDAIQKQGIAQDIKENGKAAIIERELANYECYWTSDISGCVDALEDYSFTVEDIQRVYNNTREKYDMNF